MKSEEKNKNGVANRIRLIRKNKGITMKEFGEEIANILDLEKPIGDGVVSRWESGRNLPNNERLKAIADLGNVSVDELLYGKNKFELLDNQIGEGNLKRIREMIKEEEVFSWYLEALGYDVKVYTSPDGDKGEVEIKKDDDVFHYNFNEYLKFQNDIRKSVDYQLWQHNKK